MNISYKKRNTTQNVNNEEVIIPDLIVFTDDQKIKRIKNGEDIDKKIQIKKNIKSLNSDIKSAKIAQEKANFINQIDDIKNKLDDIKSIKNELNNITKFTDFIKQVIYKIFNNIHTVSNSNIKNFNKKIFAYKKESIFIKSIKNLLED